MREIRFRQAVIIYGEFYRWHYWGLIDGAFVGVNCGNCSPTSAIENSYQYTGLHDKNGREIYEGDIVEIHHGYSIPSGVVYWNEDIAGFGVKNDLYHNYVELDTVKEVIGNIYENKELLNASK
jgi:hypothetical protein